MLTNYRHRTPIYVTLKLYTHAITVILYTGSATIYLYVHSYDHTVSFHCVYIDKKLHKTMYHLLYLEYSVS